MANHDPEKYRFSTPTYVTLYATLLTAYYMYVRLLTSPEMVTYPSSRSWDTAMSQKSRFKMQQMGITNYRKAFPQLPGNTVKNPTYIQTKHG